MIAKGELLRLCCLLAGLNASWCAAPVVFLQQAESDQGQYDLRLTPSESSRAQYLNYTKVSSNLGHTAVAWN